MVFVPTTSFSFPDDVLYFFILIDQLGNTNSQLSTTSMSEITFIFPSSKVPSSSIRGRAKYLAHLNVDTIGCFLLLLPFFNPFPPPNFCSVEFRCKNGLILINQLFLFWLIRDLLTFYFLFLDWKYLPPLMALHT